MLLFTICDLGMLLLYNFTYAAFLKHSCPQVSLGFIVYASVVARANTNIVEHNVAVLEACLLIMREAVLNDDGTYKSHCWHFASVKCINHAMQRKKDTLKKLLPKFDFTPYSEAEANAMHVTWNKSTPSQRFLWEAVKWTLERKARPMTLAMPAVLSGACGGGCAA